MLFELILSEGSASDIRVSLEDLDGLSESLESYSERLFFLGHTLGLTKGLGELLILVDGGVELKLKSLLRGLHEEIPDGLRDGIPDVSDGDLEVSIDSSSDLFHKEVRALVH